MVKKTPCIARDEGARHVRILIQARMSSTRLPAKALLPIGGYPAIVLAALRVTHPGSDVVVATSTREDDDLIAHYCRLENIKVFRGQHEDVLGRFVAATSDLSVDDICVRLTGDNVFPDRGFVSGLLAIRDSLDTTYVGYGADERSCLPYGLAGETFLVEALREAHFLCKAAPDREHVTTSIISKYRLALQPPYPGGRAEYNGKRCTIDTYDDYQRVARLFMRCPDPVGTSWQDLCGSLFGTSRKDLSASSGGL